MTTLENPDGLITAPIAPGTLLRRIDGGLVVYDGTKWKPYTPENTASPMESS